MDAEVKKILERYDEPGAYEYPGNFNYPELNRKAKLVNTEIQALGYHTTYEGAEGNQDASFSINIGLSDFMTKSAGNVWNEPVVRFSNFGSLASLTLLELLSPEVIESVLRILKEHGFTYLPQEVLDSPYDGVMNEKEIFTTWWNRYFDWL